MDITTMQVRKPKESNTLTINICTALLILYSPVNGWGNVIFKNSRQLKPCISSNLFLSEGAFVISSIKYDELIVTFNSDTITAFNMIILGWR